MNNLEIKNALIDLYLSLNPSPKLIKNDNYEVINIIL